MQLKRKLLPLMDDNGLVLCSASFSGNDLMLHEDVAVLRRDVAIKTQSSPVSNQNQIIQ